MNAGMTIATILSLLLALAAAGDTTRPQAGVDNSPTSVREVPLQHNETLVRDQGPRGHNLNHNETIARDTSQMKKAGGFCPPWMCNHNETLVRDTALTKKAGLTCPKWICGANHNETTVREVTLNSVTGGSKLKAGAVVCPKWVCGSNHNETMARDTAPMN